MYVTSIESHIDRLSAIRAYLCNEAPRDAAGDLLPPFDGWINILEVAIAKTVNYGILLKRSSAGEIVTIDGTVERKKGDQT